MPASYQDRSRHSGAAGRDAAEPTRPGSKSDVASRGILRARDQQFGDGMQCAPGAGQGGRCCHDFGPFA
jgi:hypothetical protein